MRSGEGSEIYFEAEVNKFISEGRKKESRLSFSVLAWWSHLLRWENSGKKEHGGRLRVSFGHVIFEVSKKH